jgi:1-deoxy-D-xylulose-5-phosphate synthase
MADTDTPPRFPLIAGLTRPDEIADWSDEQLADLAAEMREVIIDTVSQTGGHLGASLGTVELTIALHAELSSPRDRILWDVGHQAYGHKLLTGRLEGFNTLRQYGGISGFLRRAESEHDAMGAGHASTSISYATGLAEGLRHSRREGRVVAVIGDGALTGGMAYEGLNQAGALGSPITVVLNDNGMSISENVGALSKMFQRVRVDPTLTKVREELERGLARLPGASELGGKFRDATKSLWFVPGALFEALGFAYIGPIDGHDIEGVRRALRTTLEMDRPALVHVKTVKGRGYPPAEADGECMHGATPFVIESGKATGKKSSGPPNYTEVFGHALVAEAERDPRVVGITAAMLKGTGMQHMMKAFPERTYDVGIAEQHAVVFACGLAINGFRPVCAIYSTFLQRAFDPIIHDVAIQDLPVVFAIDRGGLVGDDGPTHHGCFDLAYLRSIPGMTIMAPMDEAELVDMLHTALRIDGPVAFRYPRGAGLGVPLPERPQPVEIGKGVVLEAGEGVALVGYGFGAALAQRAADLVAEGTGSRPTVVNARFCKPIDGTLIRQLADRHELLVTIEDHSELAGFGSAVLEALDDTPARVLRLGLPDRFIEHGKRELLLDDAGLTAERVAARTLRALREPSRMLIAEG